MPDLPFTVLAPPYSYRENCLWARVEAWEREVVSAEKRLRVAYCLLAVQAAALVGLLIAI